MMKRYIVVLGCLVIGLLSRAQDIPRGWHLLDYNTDSFYGISLNKAYQFLKQKNIKSTPILVGVIDSGIDTLHEDLKNILWHNPKEIPFNGIDDDGDGYIDDVYGWNFLGNKNGENLRKNSDEKARVYYKFKEKFTGKKIDTTEINTREKQAYKMWKRAAQEMNISTDDEVEVTLVGMALKAMKGYDSILKQEMNVDEYTAQSLESFETKTSEAKKAKFNYLTTIKLLEIGTDEKNTAIINQLEEYLNQKKSVLAAAENPPPNYRAEIIKDDYDNINDKFYGNSDVKGPASNHGSHVSGIIAAQRANGIGMDGIADNVKIIMARAVPDGDEYDKDVALAIIYEVDRGAKVINMSFGKPYSPEKYWVDSAVRYAESKDVLLIHAAGNDARNVDTVPSFPTAYFLNNNKKANNFMTIGASSDPRISKGDVIASFSNYGKETVDVFAPGVKIYSTLPNKNSYGNLQGTSMAAPVVAGIAALLRSYFPSLTAVQTKDIIEKTVIKPMLPEPINITVGKKAKEEKLTLENACKTGGIVNAANAVELAFKVDAENKKAGKTKHGK